MKRSSARATAAAAALGLAVAVVIVAMAARAPLSGATPVDARSAQAPTTALVMLLLGAGVVVLGAVILLVWPGRRPKDDSPERQPTRIDTPWIWRVVATILPFALGAALIAAAANGTRSVRTAPRFGAQPFGGGSSGATSPVGTGAGFAVPAWLPWTVVAIVLIAVGVGGLALWLRRERPVTEPAQSSAARAAVEAAIGALDHEADPRRGVIAAYRAMQRALGERGVVRLPSEAPREYLERALISTSATERDATTLTGLFEEARYSTHPIPERLREVALSALHSLQRLLQADGTQ